MSSNKDCGCRVRDGAAGDAAPASPPSRSIAAEGARVLAGAPRKEELVAVEERWQRHKRRALVRTIDGELRKRVYLDTHD